MIHCPHGHHELPPEFILAKPTWHSFSPLLYTALRKFATGVGRKGVNEIHLRHDLIGDIQLNTDELNNMSKLRFHALIAHMDNRDGTRKVGYWLLTRRGSQFLKGNISIPRRVKTLDDHVIEHSVEHITNRDLPGLPPIDLSYEIVDGGALYRTPKQQTLAI